MITKIEDFRTTASVRPPHSWGFGGDVTATNRVSLGGGEIKQLNHESLSDCPVGGRLLESGRVAANSADRVAANSADRVRSGKPLYPPPTHVSV